MPIRYDRINVQSGCTEWTHEQAMKIPRFVIAACIIFGQFMPFQNQRKEILVLGSGERKARTMHVMIHFKDIFGN
ncbi:hypothetical protein AA106555_1133 [Neokomagataea thailandica NBRC 106555]|uniref:Uncharacterized protein n=1 Tax=Neokomagataea thailandica NBRC 106555 TaxID=1223520 RepID=A0ABQ0QQ35_9PROT|nr:hypothetical protein AA106555_1133 [Neokomagataea thailandica NBRC 106555]